MGVVDSVNLLPSARISRTTRPVTDNQIPQRFREKTLASTIISQNHLHIMRNIPLFCWITGTVLEHIWKASQNGDEMPRTLTQMYIHFLMVQSTQGNRKYHGRSEKTGCSMSEQPLCTQEMFRSLKMS